MNALQADKVLKFFARRKLWCLINERHQYDRKITEWRTCVDKHLNAIEEKLRNELTTIHDVTVSIINESLRKHENGEITTKEFEETIQHHTRKYSNGSSVPPSQIINSQSFQNKTEITKSKNKHHTGNIEDNQTRTEAVKEQTRNSETYEKRTGSTEDKNCLTGSYENGKRSEIVESTNYITDFTGIDNMEHLSVSIETDRTDEENFIEKSETLKQTNSLKQTEIGDDISVGLAGSDEDNKVAGNLNINQEDKETVASALRVLSSITYKLEIDVSPGDLIQFLGPSFGNFSLVILQDMEAAKVYLEEQYFDDTMLRPVKRYTGATKSHDSEKAPHGDRLILGGAVIDDLGRVILADRIRKMLLVCEPNGAVINEVTLDMKPTGLSVMSATELAISYNSSKYDLKLPSCIEVFDINSFEQLWHFEVKGHCKNVTYRNSRFIVPCEEVIQIYDRRGNAQQLIYRPRACIRYACLDDLGRIYFTDWNSNTLQCVISDQTKVFTYQHPDMLGPTSVEIDAIGNCYVVGFISNNIHLLDTNGCLVQILLSHTDGLYEPRIINFRPFSREFIITDNSQGIQFRLFENSDVDEGNTTQTNKIISYAGKMNGTTQY